MASAEPHRVAVVTGANKGLGYYIAKELIQSQKFAKVVLACRDPIKGEATAEELGGIAAPLDLTDDESIDSFCHFMREEIGRCDVLVNNAGIAFKGSDPTPFEEQTEPTLRTNFYGTVRLTDGLLPLLRMGENPQLVNVCSMAGKLSQLSQELQDKFTCSQLNREKLFELVEQFVSDVKAGDHGSKGWSNSNYGFSKLALIAFTKMVAREENIIGPPLSANCCCPGYCATDMTSHKGPRDPAEGAQNAVILALQEPGPEAHNGEFIQNLERSEW